MPAPWNHLGALGYLGRRSLSGDLSVFRSPLHPLLSPFSHPASESFPCPSCLSVEDSKLCLCSWSRFQDTRFPNIVTVAVTGVLRFAPESHFSLLWPVCPHGWKYHLHPTNTGTDPTSLCQLGYLMLLSLRALARRSHPSCYLCLLYLLPTFLCQMAFKIPNDGKAGCGHQWSGSSCLLICSIFPMVCLALSSWAWAWTQHCSTVMSLHCRPPPLPNLPGQRSLFLENEPRMTLSNIQSFGPQFALRYDVTICSV